MKNDIEDVNVETMENSGYKARIMICKKNEDSSIKLLPECLKVIPICCLPDCPKEWHRDSSTYVAVINVGDEIWFDWTMNDFGIAVIPIFKGVNAIDGKRMKSIRMEQNPQNYVSYPSPLCLNKWTKPNGTMEKFHFTEDDKIDMASAILCENNAVPAFGFSFFRLEKDRCVENIMNYVFSPDFVDMKEDCENTTMSNICADIDVETYTSSSNSEATRTMCFSENSETCKIFNLDKHSLSEYCQDVKATIRIYFIFPEQFEKIIKSGGIRKIKSDK